MYDNPVPNPRVEAEDHYYNPKFEKLEKLGFTPSKLTDEIGLPDLIERVLRYRNNIIRHYFQFGQMVTK